MNYRHDTHIGSCTKIGETDKPSVMPDVDLTELNSTIRAELARRRMTQGHLASLLGLSAQSVNMRLAGTLQWRFSELQAVCRHLGIRITLSVVAPETADAVAS